jgi:hypothetical protein
VGAAEPGRSPLHEGAVALERAGRDVHESVEALSRVVLDDDADAPVGSRSVRITTPFRPRFPFRRTSRRT